MLIGPLQHTADLQHVGVGAVGAERVSRAIETQHDLSLGCSHGCGSLGFGPASRFWLAGLCLYILRLLAVSSNLVFLTLYACLSPPIAAAGDDRADPHRAHLVTCSCVDRSCAICNGY